MVRCKELIQTEHESRLSDLAVVGGAVARTTSESLKPRVRSPTRRGNWPNLEWGPRAAGGAVW